MALFLLASIVAWSQEVDVRAIAAKFEEVGRWRLDAEPGYNIYDPFRRAEPLVKAAKRQPAPPRPEPIRVDAVLGGRALVDGRWVEPGDRVGPYRVVAVRLGGIVVKEGRRARFIPLKRAKRLLKIKETER
jgi:hypothetical protein